MTSLPRIITAGWDLFFRILMCNFLPPGFGMRLPMDLCKWVFRLRKSRQRVEDVLDMLNIQNLRERSPHRLSGGEKKKVAVASVLALNPEVLILDEPTSGLDPKTERWLIDLLLELNRQGRTIIVSTHNLELAHVIVDRCLGSFGVP